MAGMHGGGRRAGRRHLAGRTFHTRFSLHGDPAFSALIGWPGRSSGVIDALILNAAHLPRTRPLEMETIHNVVRLDSPR
jgi:hypothetical protein